MDLKPGSRWKSAVCAAEIVVVRPARDAVTLECGGHPMIAMGEAAAGGLSLSPANATGTRVGKRYQDEESGLEVLGTKAGEGALSVDGKPLAPKDAKPLPASD